MRKICIRWRKSGIKNLKLLYEWQEAVIKLFIDYYLIVSEAKYKAKHIEGLKTLTHKQMIPKLSIASASAQVKAGKTSEHLTNEIRKLYNLCIEQKKL